MLRFLFTNIITLLTLSLSAQPNSKQEGIECNLRSIDTLLSNKSIYQSIYISPEATSVDVEDINRWAADLQESEFSKSGLEASSGYDYRFWDDNVIDDSYESGDIVHYKHRFFVSLKWNIMQSGLIGRDNFRQRVDILARAKNQEVVNSTLKSIIIESAKQQMVNLYSHFNILVETKVKLYDLLIEMQEELVAANRATMLSLSDMKIKRANVLRMLKSGVSPASGVIDFNDYMASQHIFKGDEYSTLLESNNSIIQNKLDQELIKNEIDNVSYWKEITVSPYARFSNYGDENMKSKNVVNLGVSASFPIFTNTQAKRNEIISRGKLLANNEQLIRKDISFEIADLLKQLNESFATLTILIDGAEHYEESCELAKQYYDNNTITIQELSQRYMDCLDNNIEIYKLIIEREMIKQALFRIVYGV